MFVIIKVQISLISKLDREKLHGHNFTVHCELDASVGDNGMVSDYSEFKAEIRDLCADWDECMLVPGQSPHLQIQTFTHDQAGSELGLGLEDCTSNTDQNKKHVKVVFNGDMMVFPEDDVRVLPVENITVEELSRLLLDLVTLRFNKLAIDDIGRVSITVGSGPGQSATSEWIANSQN